VIRYHAFVRVRFRAVRDIKLRIERKREREREEGGGESEKRKRVAEKIGGLNDLREAIIPVRKVLARAEFRKRDHCKKIEECLFFLNIIL